LSEIGQLKSACHLSDCRRPWTIRLELSSGALIATRSVDSQFLTKEKNMGTRLTPNQIHFCGALIVATVLGLATGSWLVFGVSLALLLAANVQPGHNRPEQPRCRCR
jgi:hypothetical protein